MSSGGAWLPPPHLLHSWQRESAPPNSTTVTVTRNPAPQVIVEPSPPISPWLALLYLLPGLAIVGAGVALHFLAKTPNLRLAGLWIALVGVICLLGSGAETRRRQLRRRGGGRYAQTSSYSYGRGTGTLTNRSGVDLTNEIQYQRHQQMMWDRMRDEDIQMQYQAQQNYQVQQQQQQQRMDDWYR